MASKKTERAITSDRSVRIGGRVYKPGQEEALLEAITPERAQQLADAGFLQGDWGKAKGRHEAELTNRRAALLGRQAEDRERELGRRVTETTARRSARTTRRTPAEREPEEEGTQVADDEPDTEGMAPPYRIEGGEGGWYGFRDANDEELLRGDGEPHKVQGQEAAEKELTVLNA